MSLRDSLKDKFANKWDLLPEFDEKYMSDVYSRIASDVSKKYKVLPSSDTIYNRFKFLNPEDVRIVFMTKDPICTYKQSTEWQLLSRQIEDECCNGLNLNLEDNMDYLIPQGVIHLSPSFTACNMTDHSNIGWLRFYNTVLQQLMKSPNPILFVSKYDDFYHDIKLEKGCFKKINEWMLKHYNTNINWGI